MRPTLIALLLLLTALASAEEGKWDVSDPPGPEKTVTIDVDEGTWMSLDVSPDGRTIVFDLLGDLYTVPFEGGEARAITSGMAWDMQPRFSPDGKQIAFTSDRGGGDNIWVMSAGGGNARQVTKEDFRLLSSPAWDPKGRFIAARKHFTSTRSLGAGEIWLYSLEGGSGLQMTERPNDQKDVGEPAFSPDGRYLYYSQDITPGTVFEYNKDPNTTIYVIQRLDRKTGETERFVSRPGGSIRPTPSPDGKHLAFVRRVRGKSVLFLSDVESGRERPLYDGLDRDMQETWAIHGVYPNMAWTPDSRQIVFWAGGKLQRIGIDGGAPAVIPFHVAGTRQVQPALRFPVEVGPERFQIKSMRWLQLSPQGDRVVFQALGRLWVAEKGGAPRALTTQTDHFEFYPSWSRDGRYIAYTTWNDTDLGTVRVIPATGGTGAVLTDRPGHYVEPAISPDGRWVVYRRTKGGYITDPAWSRDTGLYRVPFAGGVEEKLTDQGSDPHFGAEPERMYYSQGTTLKSLDFATREEREHFKGDNVTGYKVSPDGEHVAFSEGFNVFNAPNVAVGKPIELSKDTKALPVTKVSENGGNWMHWSGGKLHWSLGPTIHGQDGQPYSVEFYANSDRPRQRVAITGARILTMAEPPVIENGTVLIEGNRITALGSSVTVPADAFVIDGSGKTVMPGLVDVHWHGSQGDQQIIPQTNWVNLATLAFGVTTFHDPSNDTAEVFAAAEMERAGLIVAPRIFSTGTILYGARAPGYYAAINSLEDALQHLRRLKAMGAVSVKSYNQPRRDQRQQVIEAARQLKMMVVPEGGSLLEHNLTMVVDGHTGIEHAVPVAEIYDDVVQLWSQTKVGYTPTLGVAYGGMWGENYWYAHTDVWADERLMRFVPREVVDPVARRPRLAPEEEYNHIQAAEVATELERAGVKVNLGAHGQREGLASHWELFMFVQGGMTPMEALKAGTYNSAYYLGMDGDIGSLEPGKLADLLVLDKDPSADIANLSTLELVVKNGRVFNSNLDQLGPTPVSRPPLFWER